MSDDKTATDWLLDLFVFVPAGLALTVADELPRLADKGRHRVQGQVHTARLVGQFAVQMGRAELGKRLPLRPPVRRPSDGATVSSPAAPTPWAGRATTSHTAPATDAPLNGAERHPAPRTGRGAPASNGRQGPAAGGDVAGDLAIPGYDTLSASQVVQRLAGLAHGELEAVRRHELSHRHRRTILNRVDQLLSGGTGPAGR